MSWTKLLWTRLTASRLRARGRSQRGYLFLGAKKALLRRGGKWTPQQLFKAGDQGGAWAFDNFAYLYQDAAGTTPVTALEQSVGLILDQRFGGARGTELVNDGAFNNGIASWTNISTGTGTASAFNGGVRCVGTNATTNQGGVSQQLATVANRTYELTGSVTLASNNAAVLMGSTASGSGTLAKAVNVSGPFRHIFTALGNNEFITVRNGSLGGDVTFDDISLRELPGNHRYQATNAARGVVSARINKVRCSNANPVDFTGVAVTTGTALLTLANDAVAILAGGLSSLCTSGMVYKVDNLAGAVEAVVTITGGTGNTNLQTYGAYFRGDAGAVDLSTTPSRANFPASAGYTPFFATIAAADTSRTLRVRVPVGAVIYFILPQLVEAPTVGRIQVTTGAGAADYDPTSWPIGLRTDGQDDGSATTATDFTGTSVIATWIGARKMSDAALGSLIELGDSATPGCFRVLASLSTAGDFRMSLIGSLTSTAQTQNGYVAPMSNVISNVFDMNGTTRNNSLNTLVDGVVPASQTAGGTSPPTGGFFQNAALSFGKRLNSTSPFYGLENASIVLGRSPSAAEAANASAWVDSKTMRPAFN